MLFYFLTVYCVCHLFLNVWIEGQLYVCGVLWLRSRVDLYSHSFFTLLWVIRSCVGVWSYYYMDREESYKRFIILLYSFIVRMIALIFFSNLFITLIGWDALGVTSFLLVIYYKNRKSLGSGMLTGLTNRLGDCLVMCGIVFYMTQLPLVWTLVLLISIRITKSAQFPFSSWLPAAIAAPTPVRALVHSSTLVTAGVYVLIRYCFLDSLSLLYVGALTILLAGVRACIERDLKKIVALSTLSQLGVIIVSLGLMEKSYCFYHLISHALFKALLFLCVGSNIHIIYGTQDFRSLTLSPTIFVSLFSAVSIISLLGFLFTSGFYSKEQILESIYDNEVEGSFVFFFLLGIGLTTSYRIKMLITTILKGTYARSANISQGGFGWPVKIPLIVLGSARIVYGVVVGEFCRVLQVPLISYDKYTPLLVVVSGIVAGWFLSRLNRPLLRSILVLTPIRQLNAFKPVIADHQMPIEKGWVEMGILSAVPLTKTIHVFYGASMGIGLRVLLLLIIF